MTEAIVTVTGNLTADPVVGTTKTGDVFCSFRVAVNHGYFDREKQLWLETGASFYKVLAFRALAVNAYESLKKATPVVVQGKLRLTDWENGDKRGTEAQIKASAIGPNLTFGQADFTAVRRPHLTGDDPSYDENVRAAMEQESEDEVPGEESYVRDGYVTEEAPEEAPEEPAAMSA